MIQDIRGTYRHTAALYSKLLNRRLRRALRQTALKEVLCSSKKSVTNAFDQVKMERKVLSAIQRAISVVAVAT